MRPGYPPQPPVAPPTAPPRPRLWPVAFGAAFLLLAGVALTVVGSLTTVFKMNVNFEKPFIFEQDLWSVTSTGPDESTGAALRMVGESGWLPSALGGALVLVGGLLAIVAGARPARGLVTATRVVGALGAGALAAAVVAVWVEAIDYIDLTETNANVKGLYAQAAVEPGLVLMLIGAGIAVVGALVACAPAPTAPAAGRVEPATPPMGIPRAVFPPQAPQQQTGFHTGPQFQPVPGAPAAYPAQGFVPQQPATPAPVAPVVSAPEAQAPAAPVAAEQSATPPVAATTAGDEVTTQVKAPQPTSPYPISGALSAGLEPPAEAPKSDGASFPPPERAAETPTSAQPSTEAPEPTPEPAAAPAPEPTEQPTPETSAAPAPESTVESTKADTAPPAPETTPDTPKN
ncbi:hypothetical protein CLV40_14036 [Actinokineospora auranticolor]|uniref:Uncharacterized protein n=1 Tax=Actinokineospora auranticolor TaxID=155976 RepID=A0A2S6GBQ0_9PSEU|nr:hypothetical protein CLV40_14036 [Actinokineospora auranticolor]